MNPERVLVAHGRKHVATMEIADAVGRTLRADGFEAVVLSAHTISDAGGIQERAHHRGTDLDTMC
ncbi:hypothetical protein [Streptomyces sp. NRRL B-24572]|uniref:hypothetical protein n=1 Tax=Streptomyces sp. NRRL B-24572 TaxID=1962156 RepID=UPI00117EF121|nr:hypothetical protein [Streptomyces sp. NRRL B-24572]